MTRKRRRRTNQNDPRGSIEEMREAAQKVVDQESDALDLDPASQLFFEFAAPLLLTAETDEQFAAAASIAEFVWTTSHFDTATQVQYLYQFIAESEIPDELVPWLLDVYAELAERKQTLVG